MPTRRTRYDAAGSRSTGRACTRATASRCRRTPPCSTPGGTSTRATSQQAVEAGPAAGGAGINAAVKAQTVYANYLENRTRRSSRCSRRPPAGPTSAGGDAPKDANAHYLYAFALGRYSQGISVAKALAQGFGGKIKDALPTALKLEPKHADAHTAFGAYQAEVIDKVGGIVAGMTYGAKKDSALEHYREGAEAQSRLADRAHRVRERPHHAVRQGAASTKPTKLYEEAAACKPADAMERLDVELAKSELE